jgi:hypothetical protein
MRTDALVGEIVTLMGGGGGGPVIVTDAVPTADGIAWLVAPGKGAPARAPSPHLKLVFAAAVVDRAWRNRTQKPPSPQRRYV